MGLSEKHVLWGLGAAGVALLLWKRADLVAVVTSGARLTHGTVGDDAQIVESPDELAAAASVALGRDVDVDTYSLARMLRSEGAAEGAARVHVALNKAAASGITPTHLLTRASGNGGGHYGPQFVRDPRSVRWASTGHDPYAGDVDVVLSVYAERAAGIDPTNGAIGYADAGAFGVQDGTGSWDDYRAKQEAAGLVADNVAGLSSDFFVFRKA